MKRDKSVQALDDEALGQVVGGVNIFAKLFGGGSGPGADSTGGSRDIPLPVPTAAKECFKSPNGAHLFDVMNAQGKMCCRYCNQPRPY